MKGDVLVLLLTALLFGQNEAAGENKSITTGDFEIEVLGQSGKINLKQVSTGKRILQVSPDSLEEYENAADTTVVSQHIFNEFSKQVFTFSPPSNGMVYNASAKILKFTTTFLQNTKVSFDMYVFMENKTITVDSGEEYEVKEGSAKFNVNINNWLFCGTGQQTCNGTNGNYLDFSIEVKGMKADDKAMKANIQTGKKGNSIGKNPITYQMGDGFITLSPLYKFGGWMNMPDGYPKFVQRNSKTYFVVRFRKFLTSVSYDPIIQLAYSEKIPVSSALSITGSAYAIFFGVAIMFVCNIKML